MVLFVPMGWMGVLLCLARSNFMVDAFRLNHYSVNVWATSRTAVKRKNCLLLRTPPEKPRTAPLAPSQISSLLLRLSTDDDPLFLPTVLSLDSSIVMARFVRLNCITLLVAFLFLFTGVNVAESMDLDATSSIVPCEKLSGTNNCVSTASVKQVDLYMLPWTWSDQSVDEIASRMKGVIASDPNLSLVDSNLEKRKETDGYFFRVRAARNLYTDEIEFLINPTDRVVTFRSRQVEGPENVSDFGANRQRLDSIRQRLAVVTVMGEDSADNGPREDLSGQLRAFWGFQSGGGYESILLDEDE